jgi:hypothetical protein
MYKKSNNCICWGAGNGMRWFNFGCPVHGYPKPEPRREVMPIFPAELDEKLRRAFEELKKK